ncbi:MAG TPA: VanZ family protein [Bacilli bacterium]
MNLKKTIRWLPAILWMLVIYYLSGQTGSELNTFLPFFQKWLPFMKGFNWGHFFAYFILALTFFWALGEESSGFRLKFIIVILCLLYGLTDEYHQGFVEGRSPDIKDLLNDSIGAALAMLFISIPFVKQFYSRWTYTRKY